MKTSANGLRFLEANEGRRLDVYLDVAGIPTVGVGHRVLPADQLKVGDVIDEARCMHLLAGDVARVEAAINKTLCLDLRIRTITQNEFDALVSLGFNIGVVGLQTSTVMRDLVAGNIDDEKRAFELWDKDVQNGVKVVDAALLARRDREVALFLTPDAPAVDFYDQAD